MFFLFVVVLIHLHRGLFFTRSVEVSPGVKLCWQAEKKKSEPRRKKDDAVYQVYVKNKNEGTKTNKKKGEKAVRGFFMIPEKKVKRSIFFFL